MPRLLRRAGPGVGAGVALVVALVALGLKEALVIGVISGASYGLLALGLVLIYKSSGVFNFAQGEFGTVAVFGLYLAHINGIPYGFSLLIGLLAAIVMGLVTERLIVRPLFDAPRVTLLVATAGVSLLAIGAEIWFGEARLRNVAPALPNPQRFTVFGVQISDQRLLLLLALVGLAAVLAWFFNKTNLGLAILGASQEPTATELVGISVRRLSSFTWALAALLGGLAGVLSVPIGGTFGPGALTNGALIPAFTAAVIGGFVSLPGAFLGGAIVGITQAAAVVEGGSGGALESIPGAGSVVVFVLLLLVLAVRPQGLLGGRA